MRDANTAIPPCFRPPQAGTSILIPLTKSVALNDLQVNFAEDFTFASPELEKKHAYKQF
jgi:hypothetical protein